MALNQIRVKQYFKAYPKQQKLYFAANTAAFLSPEEAEAYGKEKKLEVFVIERENMDKPVKLGKEKIEPVTLTADEATELLKGLTLDEKSDYKQLQAVATALDIAVSGNKKADYVAALAAKQAELNTEA